MHAIHNLNWILYPIKKALQKPVKIDQFASRLTGCRFKPVPAVPLIFGKVPVSASDRRYLSFHGLHDSDSLVFRALDACVNAKPKTQCVLYR